MLYRQVTIMMDPIASVVKFVPLHELPVLDFVWGTECVRRSRKFLFLNRSYASPADEYRRLRIVYPRGDVEAVYGLEEEPRDVLAKAMRQPWLAYWLQRALDLIPKRRKIVSLDLMPALPHVTPKPLPDLTPGALKAMNDALEKVT
jgi:hypothetical protein